MTTNIVKNVAVLTTIPEKALTKLITKATYCASDAIAQAQVDGDSVVDMDIGIGILSIKLVDDAIQYHFVPSSDFNEAVKTSVINKQNLLRDILEMSLVDKITNTYKDII